MNTKELNSIIERHNHWLREDCDNWEEMRANLSRANLYGADLSRAILSRANLYGTDLSGADNIPYIPIACPDSGSFIGWKKAKCKTKAGWYDGLVKLFIPSDAKRSSATTRKCRCNKATVLSLELINTDPSLEIDCACSNYDPDFVYRVGDHIKVPNFDDDRFHECAPGIHFFINKQEAIDY